MNFTSRTSSLQAYHLSLYRTAVHPDFFGRIEQRRIVRTGDYEFEAWLQEGSHAVHLKHQGLCMAEIVTDRPETFPERGLVLSVQCAGEKDHEEQFADRIDYIGSVQTETLTEHLYLGTYEELVEHAEGSEALMVTWDGDGGRPNLSVLDIQRYADEVHVQSYHLRSDCALVLRTQSILRVMAESTVASWE